MSAPDMPFLRPRPEVARIERLASETLDLCCSKLGLAEVPLPVPVEQWIEGPLGITFGVSNLSDRGPNVLGAANVSDRSILISETLVQFEGRFRFTCAHELGHVVLHRKLAKAFQDSGTMADDTVSKANKIEWQADRFAAAFLMPTSLLVRELFAVCQKHDLDRVRCVAELMLGRPESEWLWRRKFLPEFTRRFAVSLTAVVHRFSDIRLADGKPFLLPHHVQRLLKPAEPTGVMSAITIQDGVPVRLPTLFEAP
jgi:Zn-dependent peptidase ImmA (M78 family)